tara:strand:- start:25 stop:777 length:753 start_codon:yes stop_codon:yes gene_type:complete
MAKKFYYDSVNLLDATITAGTLSGTTFSTSASAITNEHFINDQSIGQAVSSFGLNDAIRIDFGSAKAITDVLTHNNSTSDETDNLIIYYNSSASDIGSAFAINETSPPGWDLVSASSQSARYWYIRSSEGTHAGLTEVILGVPLEFENEPDIGIATQEIFATDLNTSLGGVEYANKRHEPKTTFQLNFSNISETFKNNLVSFEQDVTNFKKFVYYDDSSYHYVRLDSPIKFTEVAFQRFSASLKLREQLS